MKREATLPRTAWLSYGVFFLSGINTMLLSLVVTQFHPALPDATVGRMLGAQFAGQLCGPFFVSRHAKRSVVAGLLIAACGAAAIGFWRIPPLWVLAVYGLGLGLTMTATNILVGEEAEAGEQAPKIELLNAFWPLGAACAPLLLRLLSPQIPMRAYWFVAANCLLSAPLLWRLKTSTRTQAIEQAQPKQDTSRLVWLCALALLAVGLEASLSNWSPTFAMRYAHSAGLAAAVFWVGILTGRVAASAALRRVSWRRFAAGCAALSAVATVLLVKSGGAMVYAAVFVAALGVAPIYPAVLAQCLRLRGKSLVFVSAGIGSAAWPWLMGTVAARAGSLRVSLLAATAAAAMLCVLLVLTAATDARAVESA